MLLTTAKDKHGYTSVTLSEPRACECVKAL